MSNGDKKVVFNTRERVISNDFNRLQDIISQTRATTLARLHGDQYNVDSPGYAPQQIIGGQSPMIADVYGGLFVKVDDPNSLFVDPGVVGVVDPETVPDLDDEPYKVINDPGLLTGGLLVWLANASGSIRIDVVVADVVDLVLETDNRDSFDPSTGLFTPSTVNKVIAKRLSYSILRGIPGAGMPALPNQIVLAVASVPDGTTDWSDVTFWDVRPLVQSRITYHKRANDNRRYYDFDFKTDATDGTTHSGYGYCEYNGYLVGGRLMAGVPGLGDVEFDSNDPANSTTGDELRGAAISPDDVGANPIFLIFPSGLPRWARYSVGNAPGQSIRGPYGTTGILVGGRFRSGISDYAKVDRWGNATAVAIPSSVGILGLANGVLLHMMQNRSDSGSGDAVPVPLVGIGRRIIFPIEMSGVIDFAHQVKHSITSGWALNDTEIFHNVSTDWWANGGIAVPRNARVVTARYGGPGYDDNGLSPSAAFASLGIGMYQEGTFNGGVWSYAGLGDGTASVSFLTDALGEAIDIPIDDSITPVQIRIKISGTGIDGIYAAPSPWTFNAPGSGSKIIVAGYEV